SSLNMIALINLQFFNAFITPIFFFFYRSGDPQNLHSFPTRRSSDLGDHDLRRRHVRAAVRPGGARGDRGRRGRRRDADHVLLGEDRKSTRLNSSHVAISYAVFCLKKKIMEMLVILLLSVIRKQLKAD